ncbi:MAG: M1 family metallopeptidase [Bacteroidota bacterium]
MKKLFLVLLLVGWAIYASATDCDPYFPTPYSPRIANYDMKVILDHDNRMLDVTTRMVWNNTSPDTITTIPFYMYLNSFKNTYSTFIHDAGGSVFRENLTTEPEARWGWCDIDKMTENGTSDVTGNLKYIQPNNDNILDQSVLELTLAEPIMPGDSVVLDFDWRAKIPEVIARCGYSRDYYLFVHWFPQAGVYEQNVEGVWGWNCHQFMPGTEFFADFGVYNVEMTIPDYFIIGASGCRIKEVDNKDGTKTYGYYVEDVIDFAWTISPRFVVVEEQWEHVTIRLLIQPEHAMLSDRFMEALKGGFAYFDEHVGPYVYPTLTVVDPPLHGLRSGLMEYPTLITGGTFYNIPKGIRTSEALLIHEFGHQYYMSMLASNEKEEPWLDEGMVTYMEDCIMDELYGERNSIFDILGYRTGTEEMSRLEYTGMNNPKAGSIARPGWEFTEGRKGFQYSKTATWLHTMENMFGTPTMRKFLKRYYQEHAFTHPKAPDLLRVLNEVVSEDHGLTFGENLDWLTDQVLYGTDICDYAIGRISNFDDISPHGIFDGENGEKEFRKGERSGKVNSAVTVYRLGELIIPTEVRIKFEDGTEVLEKWDGIARTMIFEYQRESRIVSAQVDPEYKITLDVDMNNNSKTLKPNKKPLWKYAIKALFWLQNTMSFATVIG